MYEEHEEYEEEIVVKRRFSELLDRESRADHMRRLSMRFPEEVTGFREEDNVSNNTNDISGMNNHSHGNMKNSNILSSGSYHSKESNPYEYCTDEEDRNIALNKTKEHLKEYFDQHHTKSKDESIIRLDSLKSIDNPDSGFLDMNNNKANENIVSKKEDVFTHPEIVCNRVEVIDDSKKIVKDYIGESNASKMGESKSNMIGKSIKSDDGIIGNMAPQNMNITHCHECKCNLMHQQFVLKNEYAYCISCYESKFGSKCSECNQVITVGSKDLVYGERHWHKECFKCFKCSKSLADRAFHVRHRNEVPKDLTLKIETPNDQTLKNETLNYYCQPCYDNTFFTMLCKGCNQRISSGSSSVQYGSNSWHGKCFSCNSCSSNLARDSFVPRDDKYYCIKCYQDNFAHQCHKCSKIIEEGGLSFRKDNWHWNCFICANCKKSLAGSLFLAPQSDPYCLDCYGALFENKCIVCMKPILGVRGEKMITLEQGSWHSECFNCSNCASSLVQEGFIIHDSPPEEDEPSKNPAPRSFKLLCVDCAMKSSDYLP